MNHSRFRPVSTPERIGALDVLRGFALLGIFFVNIQLFAQPLQAMERPLGGDQATGGEIAAWAFIRTFAEMKFFTLFSLLFGMGAAIQLARAEARGTSFEWFFARRMVVLGIVGALHALFIWYGDILFVYAGCGLVFLVLARVPPAGLLAIAAILLAFAALGLGALEFLQEPPPEPGAEIDLVAFDEDPWGIALGAVGDGRIFDDAWSRLEHHAYSGGSYRGAFVVRAVTWVISLLVMAILFAPRVLGMFLLGAALVKLRVFDADRRSILRWLAGVGLVGGLGGEVLSTWLVLESPPGRLAHGAGSALHHPASLLLSLGYAGGIALAVEHAGVARLTAPLAAAGRMALTNYLLQSLVATTVMYGYGLGLGLFGQWGRPRQVAFVLAVFAAQVAASAVVLRYFRMGPFEWGWRRLTYGKKPAGNTSGTRPDP